MDSEQVKNSTITASQQKRLIIVGAGPSGLLLALLLAQHGIASLVLEAYPSLDTRLRASQYGVPATRVFRRVPGLLEDFRREAVASFPHITWRRVADGATLARVDMACVADHEDRMTVLPLGTMVQIMYRHCLEHGSGGKGKGLIEVRFRHRVLDVGQDEERAWVDIEIDGGSEGGDGGDDVDGIGGKRKERMFCDYVVGCDGGTSQVRKSLFGRHWPGETFGHQLIVTNIWYDGFDKHGWDGGNYEVDNQSWGLIAKRGKGGLWRVTIGDEPGHTEAEYLKRRAWHFARMLPGHPTPDQYETGQTNMYRIHNRCVDAMRVGRVLLAGDAAHVCNPFGGYGCMAAVLDVDGLADCLVGYLTGRADEGILDVYAQVRREKFLRYVDARSRKNMERLHGSDPWTVAETDPFLRLLKSLEGDEGKRREFLLKSSSIEYDFKQHYHSAIDELGEEEEKLNADVIGDGNEKGNGTKRENVLGCTAE